MNQPLPYQTSGRVIHGAGRGRTLGFPTANLDVALPANLALGIYAGWATVNHSTNHRPALIYWGKRPTFDERVAVCEVLLFNETETVDLYDSVLQIDLVAHLRPDQRFHSPRELMTQIQADMTQAATVLGVPPRTG